jgi:hypothetical protein
LNSHLVLQIHDEVVVEAPIEHQEQICRIVQESMEHPLPEGTLLVSIPVKIFVGERWGSLEALKGTEIVQVDQEDESLILEEDDTEIYE